MAEWITFAFFSFAGLLAYRHNRYSDIQDVGELGRLLQPAAKIEVGGIRQALRLAKVRRIGISAARASAKTVVAVRRDPEIGAAQRRASGGSSASPGHA